MPNLKIFFGIGIISSLAVFAGSTIAPIEARYIHSFTDSSVVVGTVFAVGSIGLAVLSFYLGRLSDRVGRKRVILLGLCFGVIYALLYSLVYNVFHIYGVKLAWAFSAVATGPILNAYLQDFLAKVSNKGEYFGYIFSVQSITGSAGALLGGYLGSTYGLVAPFYAVMIIFAVLVPVAWLLLPARGPAHVGEENEQRKLSPLGTIKYFFSKPALVFYLATNTSHGINWGIKWFLWPLVIFELAGDDLVTGSVIATTGVVAFITLPFAGKLVDKIGVYKATFIQFTLYSFAGAGMVFSGNITMFWIFVSIYTLGEVLNVSQFVLLTENVESGIRGTVLGLDASMDQMLGVLAPLFAGFLITLVGLTATLGVFISLFWISLFFVLVLYPRVVKS